MLNKKISFRELVMIGFLVLFVAYYFAVQVPVSKNTQELEMKIAEVQSETDIAMAQLAQMKAMEKAVENAENNASGKENPLPEYNNINNIINELNVILGSKAITYNIDFTTEIPGETITSRIIPITFNTADYDTALNIIESINNSANKYLMNSVSIIKKQVETNGAYTVNINLSCFEYNT